MFHHDDVSKNTLSLNVIITVAHIQENLGGGFSPPSPPIIYTLVETLNVYHVYNTLYAIKYSFAGKVTAHMIRY